MPRKTRMYLPDMPVHVVQRGNNRNACFFCEDEYRYFLERLREGQGRFGVALHAYVLMTNHVHLLMTRHRRYFHGSCSTSDGMMFYTSTASTGRSGTLWEGRHKASLVQADQSPYLYALHRIEPSGGRAWCSLRRSTAGLPIAGMPGANPIHS